METKLLFADVEKIALAEGNVRTFQKKVQRVVDSFASLGLDIPMTRDLLNQLLRDPVQVVRDLYSDMVPATDEHTHLPVNKAAVMASIVLPDIRTLKELCHDLGRDTVTLSEYLSLFRIGKTVVLDESRLDDYFNKYRYYSDDESILELYNKLKQVGDILTEVNNDTRFISSNNSLIDYNLGELFKLDEDKELVLRMDGFKSLARKL